MGVEDLVDRHVTIAHGNNSVKCSSRLPQAGRVKVALETGNQMPTPNSGNVARNIIEKASARRSVSTWINLDLARLDKGVGRACTMQKDRKDWKTASLRDDTQGELDEEDHF